MGIVFGLMRIDKIILVVGIVGVMVLFMFPEPESNFGWYVLTGFLFACLIGGLVWLKKRNF